jgi:hypothetical protein
MLPVASAHYKRQPSPSGRVAAVYTWGRVEIKGPPNVASQPSVRWGRDVLKLALRDLHWPLLCWAAGRSYCRSDSLAVVENSKAIGPHSVQRRLPSDGELRKLQRGRPISRLSGEGWVACKGEIYAE